MVSITYRTAHADWGAGKGANLTAGEVDRNFHNLRLAVDRAAGTPGRGIASMTQSGYVLTVTYSDATSESFTLPAPDMEARGAWVAGTSYARGDLVSRLGGSYLCVAPHVAAGWWTDLRAGCWATLAGTLTDSPTVLEMATGVTLNWEIPGGLGFTEGMRLRVMSQADRSRWMEGAVSSYTARTGAWWLSVDVEAASGGGTLSDPILAPSAEGVLASGGGGGAWTASVPVSGSHTVTPSDIGRKLTAQAGSLISLPGAGFQSGDAFWLEAPKNGTVTVKAIEGKLEPPYVMMDFSSERVWLVHQGGGDWLVANREALPGTPPRIAPWRYALALPGDITVSLADLGSLIVCEDGATVTLPGTYDGVQEGDMVWLAAGQDYRTRITVSAPGGVDYTGGTDISLDGQIVQFVSLGYGRWIIASTRRLNMARDCPIEWVATTEVAAGATHALAVLEAGHRFRLGMGATLALPAVEEAPDGAVVWVEGESGAQVTGPFVDGGTARALSGRRARLIADHAAGAWFLAEDRPGHPATLVALDSQALGATSTGVLADAQASLSTGDSYSDAAVAMAVNGALSIHNKNVAELAGQVETLRLLLRDHGLLSE
ncbi:MAG: hypothetical protein K9H25_16265 [Rhodospirillum sp.]|nr:hypothetical protein [Rhodospirillum sp.]MCF8489639.1 hypothetical protein [Rhodospirillum sp.]